MNEVVKQRRRWRPGLGPTVGLLLVGMVLVTASVMFGIYTYGARSSALAVSESLVRQAARRTQDRVDRFLDVPRDALELGQLQAYAGVLPLEDPLATEAWFYDFMVVYESVAAVAYGDADGNFTMVKRMTDGGLSTKRVIRDGAERHTLWRHRAAGADFSDIARTEEDPDDSYDPRFRPWYIGAVETRSLFWTRVYVFWTDKKPGVTASLPIYKDSNTPVGVISLDISLADFSEFLTSLQIGERGRAIVLDAQGRVVAGLPPRQSAAERDQLPIAAESGLPEVDALGLQHELQDALAGAEQTLRFTAKGEPWLGMLSPIQVGAGNAWVIAVLAPEADFLGELERARRQSRAVLLVCIGVALMLSAVLTRWLTTSLNVLLRETARVRDLHLEQSPVDDAPFREIGEVLEAFEGMKTGLRSFQKYVPMELVRQLLKEKKEPELGGEPMTLTLFFSDIANFTPITEALGAAEMAIRLGAYHSAMTRTIQALEGTVVQYVGDEIMAFWGAPTPVADHAAAACQAALACQQVAESLWSAEPEIPTFHTRMGVHTATVAVGHFGSTERLYYGAIGDGVNLASRLESINKYYGTRVIVSEHTWTQVSDRFEARRLDLVAVKGKSQSSWIFELLAEKGEAAPELLEAARRYERGLALYHERRWLQAQASFREALAMRPKDRAAELMIGRCQDYSERPPPEEWDGVYAMTQK